jgi:hypothetical protein
VVGVEVQLEAEAQVGAPVGIEVQVGVEAPIGVEGPTGVEGPIEVEAPVRAQETLQARYREPLPEYQSRFRVASFSSLEPSQNVLAIPSRFYDRPH